MRGRETGGGVGAGIRALAAVLLVLILVLSHRNVPTVLALLGASGLVALPYLRLPHWSVWVLALAAWAALSAAWSPYDDAGSWPPYLGALVLGTLGLASVRSAPSVGWILIGGAVALALLSFEAATGGLLRDLTPPDNRPDKDDVASARGITSVLFLVPALMLAASRRVGAMALLILLPAGVAASAFGITANALAFMAGIGAAALAMMMPRWTLRLGMGAAALCFVAVPILVMALPPTDVMMEWTQGPPSWRMRLLIWKDVWAAVTGDGIAPFLFGHGVEGARVLGDVLGPRLVPGAEVASAAVPTHPHNIFLQIWHDLGLVGVILSLGGLVMAARAVDRAALRGQEAAAVAALIAVTLVFALIDASLWTLWRTAGPILGAWILAQVVNQRNLS